MKAAGLLLLLLACAWPAQAPRAQTCTMSTQPVAFGMYQTIGGSAVTTTGTVTVSCVATVALLESYTMALSVGGGSGFTTRSMGGVSPRLGYQLYRDPALSQIWGDGTGGSFTLTDGYLIGVLAPVVKSYPVYGNIPAGEQAAVGTYTDSVMVTLTY